MPLSNQAPAARTSLLYITGGSVLIVWTVIWLIYCFANPPTSGKIYYFIFGFLATGVVLLFIGLRLGAIGRSAKQAESAPQQPQQVLPSNSVQVQAPQPVVPGAPVSVVTVPPAAVPQNGQPVVTTPAQPRVTTGS